METRVHTQLHNGVDRCIDLRHLTWTDNKWQEKETKEHVTHGAFHRCHQQRLLKERHPSHRQGLRPEGPSPWGSRPGRPQELGPKVTHLVVRCPWAHHQAQRISTRRHILWYCWCFVWCYILNMNSFLIVEMSLEKGHSVHDEQKNIELTSTGSGSSSTALAKPRKMFWRWMR